MKHTPGHWITTGVNVRAGDALICYATNHWADCETDHDEKLANARLIAAAPELLQALKDLLEDQRDASLPILAKARAIIEKVEGES
jgi:hypothetical protein